MLKKSNTSPAARALNLLLLISFIVTNLVPLTGLIVHKMASAIFLLLCIVHTLVYRKQLKGRAIMMLGIVAAAFFSGVFGLIYDDIPLILALHKVISIGSIFVLAIHIFVYHRRFRH